MSDDRYAPGTFRKGGRTVVADTTADAVKYLFEGFSRVESSDSAEQADEAPEAQEKEQPKGEPVSAPAQPGQSRSFSDPAVPAKP